MEALNLTGSFSMEIFLSTVESFCMKSWNQVSDVIHNYILFTQVDTATTKSRVAMTVFPSAALGDLF